jgi:hypothetical protein
MAIDEKNKYRTATLYFELFTDADRESGLCFSSRSSRSKGSNRSKCFERSERLERFEPFC